VKKVNKTEKKATF